MKLVKIFHNTSLFLYPLKTIENQKLFKILLYIDLFYGVIFQKIE